MKAAAFARLCCISPPMVSKYQAQGLISVNGKDVDARASLDMLAGRLDESKRMAALARLDALGEEPSSIEHAAPAGSSAPRQNASLMTGKAAKDYYQSLMVEMDYRKKAGELVLASDVAAQADLAVSAMRETFSHSRREAAKAFCVQFDIAPDRETAVMRFLSDQFERSLGRFAEACAKMAESPLALTAETEPAPSGALQAAFSF